jgi:hypothetical protein
MLCTYIHRTQYTVHSSRHIPQPVASRPHRDPSRARKSPLQIAGLAGRPQSRPAGRASSLPGLPQRRVEIRLYAHCPNLTEQHGVVASARIYNNVHTWYLAVSYQECPQLSVAPLPRPCSPPMPALRPCALPDTPTIRGHVPIDCALYIPCS